MSNLYRIDDNGTWHATNIEDVKASYQRGYNDALGKVKAMLENVPQKELVHMCDMECGWVDQHGMWHRTKDPITGKPVDELPTTLGVMFYHKPIEEATIEKLLDTYSGTENAYSREVVIAEIKRRIMQPAPTPRAVLAEKVLAAIEDNNGVGITPAISILFAATLAKRSGYVLTEGYFKRIAAVLESASQVTP
jgi:hypothetical protein